MPIRVLLADDTEIVRKAITSLLECDPEIQVVGEAASLKQTLEVASKLKPHVIVMGIRMGDEMDISPLAVKSRLAKSKLLGVSIWNDDEAKALARDFGMVKLLDKISLGTLLIPAIKQCVAADAGDS